VPRVLEHNTCPSSPQVHVLHTELGTAELVPIRGSPFTVAVSDQWVRHRAGGAAPGKRKGATLLAVGGELVSADGLWDPPSELWARGQRAGVCCWVVHAGVLGSLSSFLAFRRPSLRLETRTQVLYGGDKSGATVCSPAGAGGEWRWSPVAAAGGAPPDRALHGAAVSGGTMAVFGGSPMDAGGAELADVWLLRKQGSGWSWQSPQQGAPYVRWALVMCVLGVRA
jgi:hypothetical protein